jgi:hypothetical protein
MKNVYKAALTLAGLLALSLMSCATSMPNLAADSSRREPPALLTAAGIGSQGHIMRIQQLRDIPRGATVGILSGGASLSGFLEMDLESKGLVVRQIDVYSMLSARQKTMIDPAGDFVYINSVIDNLPALIKESSTAATGKEGILGEKLLNEKLLTQDSIAVELQLAEHYLDLVATLRDLIKSLNVEYLIVAGPAYTELSYAAKIYDSLKFDLIYTCLFIGAPSDWRNMVGNPQKDQIPNGKASWSFEAGKEPAAYWEMSFSSFAAKNLIVGASAAK